MNSVLSILSKINKSVSVVIPSGASGLSILSKINFTIRITGRLNSIFLSILSKINRRLGLPLPHWSLSFNSIQDQPAYPAPGTSVPAGFQFYPRSTELGRQEEKQPQILSILSKINFYQHQRIYFRDIQTFNSIQDQHKKHGVYEPFENRLLSILSKINIR